jgi:hypothetical protein
MRYGWFYDGRGFEAMQVTWPDGLGETTAERLGALGFPTSPLLISGQGIRIAVFERPYDTPLKARLSLSPDAYRRANLSLQSSDTPIRYAVLVSIAEEPVFVSILPDLMHLLARFEPGIRLFGA